MRCIRTLASTMAFTLVLPASIAMARGTIVKLDGTAAVERQGQSVPAAAASPVRRGDTLKVGPHSRAQLRLDDDSVFTVAGAASLRIDDFSYAPSGRGRKAIYTLQEGGFRTITGAIGKQPQDQYEVRTEQATITVKGSAYSTLICKSQCGSTHRAGLYVKGESGVIILTNPSGQLQLRAGEVAYVQGGASAPVTVTVSPFDDPAVAAEFEVEVQFDTEIHPPRVEPEPPASPS